MQVHEMPINHFRKHVAIVSQEPKLFQLSIAENIGYGLDHTLTEVRAHAMHVADGCTRSSC